MCMVMNKKLIELLSKMNICKHRTYCPKLFLHKPFSSFSNKCSVNICKFIVQNPKVLKKMVVIVSSKELDK